MLDDDQLDKIIRKGQGDKSLRAYAREIGVSAPYLSDVLRGNRNPGPKILKFFGLQQTKKVTVTYTVTKKPKSKPGE